MPALEMEQKKVSAKGIRDRRVGHYSNSSSRKTKDDSCMERNDNKRSNAVVTKKGGRKGNRSTPRPPNQIITAWQPPTGEISDIKQTWNLFHVHPIICQYIEQYINLRDITRGANKEIDDLPKLEEYICNNGRSTICLDWCLGICSSTRKGRCQFRHAEMEHITETFTHKLCKVLRFNIC